jgi:hypothetical protein
VADANCGDDARCGFLKSNVVASLRCGVLIRNVRCGDLCGGFL